MKFNFRLDIENMPPLNRRLLLILPSLIIIALSVYFFIMPLFEEQKMLSEEVKKQQDDISIAQQKTAKLPALIAENRRLQDKLTELQMQLPEEKEVSPLLRQVSLLGIRSGLEVLLWKPKEKSVHASKQVFEIPVEVEMRGAYHNFGQFFSGIIKLSRIVNMPDMKIVITTDPKLQKKQKKDKKDKSALKASLIAKTYSIITEKDKKELEAAEKEKKK